MKRMAMVLGSVLLVAAVSSTGFAYGPRWGKGNHGWGRGGGPGSCWQYGGGYTALTQEQWTQLDKLHQKFYDGTATLRNQLWTKRGELRILLNTSNPDAAKAMSLQKEISDLRTQMAQKRIQLQLDARKIAPNGRYGGGRWHGKGHFRGGYGQGRCWN